jgi:predicted DNA-binding transcriptional regulator YafY
MGTSTASPTSNVLRTLELVQTHTGISADDLADRLQVSDRAVRRYIAILREAGVPVESTRGRYGGYHIGRSLQPPPMMFTASEALGLVMAVLDGHHAAADPEDPVGSALGKLIRSLPSHTARHAALVREHARAAPDRTAARPDPSITASLVEAVGTRRGLRLSYTTAAGSSLDTRVDPWAIVVRHGRWYLLCMAHEANAARAYRVDRIHRVDILNVDVEPPTDLNPVAWLEAHLGTGWKHQTCVEFDAPIDIVAPFITAPMGQLEASHDGTRCVLRGTTNNPTMYAAEWLAAIPHPFKVLDGPELREAVTQLARRMLDAVSTTKASMPANDR